MTDASNNAHRVMRATPLPRSPEEILAGDTQAGVPRPSFLKDHEDDGTVHRVGDEAGGACDGAD